MQFDSRDFLGSIAAQAKKIDRLRSEVDRLYNRLDRIRAELNIVADLDVGALLPDTPISQTINATWRCTAGSAGCRPQSDGSSQIA
ncbi:MULTISPECIES: hypothetical protein [unclassified Ensifer]|uniref:hypothetical protein n=1 Tax=unclassified Ensifer TaxID=2633371 RepID=UPI000709EBE6|nr:MULTISPECIES: hypothetical protein [unclassified Ensifer]KQW39282.1 hypothetical protein ASD02_36365 [Ensifer sp. Root1252]KRC62218.1 hypothetical protein ASE32_36330 [Ensifer sp. Root231]KRC91108.1 hypothetical protein ASE47_36355 [Ensifer sp. Root258]